jgi:hypothetical protein
MLKFVEELDKEVVSLAGYTRESKDIESQSILTLKLEKSLYAGGA